MFAEKTKTMKPKKTEDKEYKVHVVPGKIHWTDGTPQSFTAFKYLKGNRDIKLAVVQKLMASMKKHGYIMGCPVLVVLREGVPYVIDGQHRLEAAHQLFIPFSYMIVDSDDLSVVDLNTTAHTWTAKDFLKHWAELGKNTEHYTELRDFHKETGISISSCIMLMGANDPNADHKHVGTEEFRLGTFRVGNRHLAHLVAKILFDIGGIAKECKQRGSLKALSLLCALPEFDLARLTRQMNCKYGIMQYRKCIPAPTVEAWLKLYEEVYNARKGPADKVLLSSLVREAQLKAESELPKRSGYKPVKKARKTKGGEE